MEIGTYQKLDINFPALPLIPRVIDIMSHLPFDLDPCIDNYITKLLGRKNAGKKS